MSENNPLILTDAAITHLCEMLARKPEKLGLRLSIKETGCTGLMYVPELVDSVPDGDIVWQAADNLRIYIDPEALPAIAGTTIDYVSVGLGQKQLAYDNPNADSLCGCGESFNLKKDIDESK